MMSTDQYKSAPRRFDDAPCCFIVNIINIGALQNLIAGKRSVPSFVYI